MAGSDPNGWDRYAQYLGGSGPGPVAPPDDGWSRYESYLTPAPPPASLAAPLPNEEASAEPEGPSLLDRAKGALSALNPVPVAKRFGRDFMALTRVLPMSPEAAATEAIHGNPLPEYDPQAEDIVPAARAATSMLFPVATAIETGVGGVARGLAGEEDAGTRAYEEGVFGSLASATGLDEQIAEIENPLARAGIYGAGEILTGGGLEYAARRGAHDVVERASNIGKEVAAGFDDFARNPGSMASPGAVNAVEGQAPMPGPAAQRMERMTMRALPPGPAPRVADPFVAGPEGVREPQRFPKFLQPGPPERDADPFVAGAGGVREPRSRQRALPPVVRDPAGNPLPDHVVREGERNIVGQPVRGELGPVVFDPEPAPVRVAEEAAATPSDAEIDDLFDGSSGGFSENARRQRETTVFKKTRGSARALSDEKLLDRYRAALRNQTMAGAGAEAVGGKGVRKKRDFADPDQPIGAVGTGAGAFERGRSTQADARLLAYEDEIRSREGLRLPTVEEAFTGARRQDLPSDLADELDAIRTTDDDRLLEQWGMAEEEALASPGDPVIQARRAMIAGEVEKRGLLLDEAGSVRPEVAGAIARTGIGAAAGGAIDASEGEDSPIEGALLGAAAGAGAGVVSRSLKAAKNAPAPAYLDDPDVTSMLSKVSTGERAAPAFRQRVRAAGNAMYTRLVDQLHPLKQFGENVGGDKRVSQEAARAAGWRAAAEERLTTDFRQVVQQAEGHEKGAISLVNAERALELADNGMTSKGIDLDEARRVVDKLGRIPEVRQAADALRGYYRQLLDYKLANGVITQEAYDNIVAKGEAYVPFVRDLDDAAGPSAGGGRLVNRGTGVRKMTDSEVKDLATIDPYQQAILDTMEAERTVAKQRVTNVVAEIVESNPQAAAPFVRQVPKAEAGKRTVQANVNGKRRFYEVTDDEMFNAWAAFDPRTQTVFSKVLRPFAQALRIGVTTLPDFALANAIRDNMMAAIQYPFSRPASIGGGATGAVAGAAADDENRLRGAALGAAAGAGGANVAKNIARTMKAMRSIVKDDDVYREWVREGGAGFGFYASDPKGAKKILEQLRASGVSPTDIVRPKKWWHAFQAINHAVEQAPRLARFRYLREQGAEIPEAIASSRDISLDFRRIGKDMQGAAEANAFFNAQVQGWDKLIRLLKKPKTYAAGAAMLTAPSVALWSINKDNPEYWARPTWERNLFWLVPKGGEEGGFWRIPKPFEIGFIFASLPERLLDYAYQRDPQSLKRGLGDMLSTYGVSNILPLTTAATPIIENIANHDMFTDRPIVNVVEQRLPAELQYDEDTSSLAVGLGRATGLSPKRIDHTITGYTGTGGQTVLDLTSKLARATGLDDRPAPAAGSPPLVGRFSTRPDVTSDAEAMLYERFSAGERARNGVRELAQAGDQQRLQEFIQRHADELRDYFALKEKAAALEKVREARRTVRESPQMTAEQKRGALTRLSALATQIASARKGDQSTPNQTTVQ